MTYADSYAVRYEFDAATGVASSNQATSSTEALAAAQARQTAATVAQTAAMRASAQANAAYAASTRASAVSAARSRAVSQAVAQAAATASASGGGNGRAYTNNPGFMGPGFGPPPSGSFGRAGGSFGSTVNSTPGSQSFLYQVGQGIARNQYAPPSLSSLASSVSGTLKQGWMDLGKTLSSTTGKASDFFDRVRDGSRQAAQQLAPLGRVVGGITAFFGAAAAGGWSLMKEAGDFDALKMSLRAFDGKKSDDELTRLRSIGKAPGLGFTGAVDAYTGLRNAQFSQGDSERIIREVANANARGGGNNESFETVMMHLREMASQQFANERNIRGIANARIPVNSILQNEFGTSDTEQLKAKGITSQKLIAGLIDGLSKLERVAGSERTTFDNLGDAIHNAEVSAGEGLNRGLLPYVSQVEKAVENLTEGGEIEEAFKTAAQNVADALGGDTEHGAEDVLRNILVEAKDMSAALRNLVLNSKGAAEWVSDHVKQSVVGHAMGWDKDDGGQDMSAVGEHERNVADSQADKFNSDHGKYIQAKKDNRFRGNYESWTRRDKTKDKDAKDAPKKPMDPNAYARGISDGTIKPGTGYAQWVKQQQDASSGTPPAPVTDKVVPLLEKIAINTKRTADLEDASTGGSSVDAAISAQSLASVTGQGTVEYHIRQAVAALTSMSMGNTQQRLRRSDV